MSLPRDLSFTFPHAPTKSPLRTPLPPSNNNTTTTGDITALPTPAPRWDPNFSTLLTHPPSDLALRHPNPTPVPRVPGTSSTTLVNVEGGEKLERGRWKKRRASSLDFEPWCVDGGAGAGAKGRGGWEGKGGMEYGEYEDWELEEVVRRLKRELGVVEGELGRRRKGRARKGEKKVKKGVRKMEEGKMNRGKGTVVQRVRGWFGRKVSGKGKGKMQIGLPRDAQKNEWPEEIREAYDGMR